MLIRQEGPPFTVHRLHLPPQLKEGERGALIVMPGIKVVERDGGISITGIPGFDPDELRGGLLLFEHLVHPGNSMISMGTLAEFVGDTPGTHDCRVEMSGRTSSGIFSTALAQVFVALNNREPGRWSLARSAQQAGLPPSCLGGLTAFKIKLENALPLPDRSVSLEEVLSYRERKREELLALRITLDEAALELSRNGFGGFAETHALERLQAALRDHARAAAEQNFLKRLASLDVTFNWSGLVAGIGASAAMLPQSLGLALGGVAASVAASISVESAIGLRNKDSIPRPFDYLLRAQNEM